MLWIVEHVLRESPYLSRILSRGGLVVRPRGLRVPGSNPNSTNEPPCKWSWCTPNVLPLVWCPQPTSTDSPIGFRVHVGVVRKFGEGWQIRCLPRHLIVVQNNEVRLKIALMLLQNGTLI
ncbi:hypothetical protein AVEN_223789-1 [Araneus ventricosus]|uniref:Uncharacterized protein n=1 Tax=Araneus ventricosus TaxID=182803 RepID=A0A4Y2DM14_ARAVE|nr:hypothetical protein AVEN_223789-1 [Araneus ventricosus]